MTTGRRFLRSKHAVLQEAEVPSHHLLALPARQAYDYWQELPLQETRCFARNFKKASFCTKNARKCALPLFWEESSSRSWSQDNPLEDPPERLDGRF